MSAEAKKRAAQIRAYVAEHRIKYYELADALEVSYNTLNRWLRCGLTEDRFLKIQDAIVDMEGDGDS